MTETIKQEPYEYFAKLKASAKQSGQKDLSGFLGTVQKEMLQAKAMGQTKLLHSLVFAQDCIAKEMELLANGIEDFVYMEDIMNTIKDVKPENSIKIIELENFPRPVPDEKRELIKKAMELGVFDNFYVVYTDFTDTDPRSEEEKKQIERNRDPVVFGVFEENNVGFSHNRWYMIADWEDDYCDLTFDKLVEKMSETDNGAPGKIEPDHTYLLEISEEVRKQMKENRNNRWGGFERETRSNNILGAAKRIFGDLWKR